MQINTTEQMIFPMVFINLKTSHVMVASRIDNMYFIGKSLDNIGKSFGEISDYFINDYILFSGILDDNQSEVFLAEKSLIHQRLINQKFK